MEIASWKALPNPIAYYELCNLNKSIYLKSLIVKNFDKNIFNLVH